MFFDSDDDSDDYQVETNVIPCDSKETAKAIVEKIYEKAIEHNYSFEDEKKKKQWEDDYVKRNEDGSIHITGGDCVFGTIDIIEKEQLSMNDVPTFKPEVASIY